MALMVRVFFFFYFSHRKGKIICHAINFNPRDERVAKNNNDPFFFFFFFFARDALLPCALSCVCESARFFFIVKKSFAKMSLFSLSLKKVRESEENFLNFFAFFTFCSRSLFSFSRKCASRCGQQQRKSPRREQRRRRRRRFV